MESDVIHNNTQMLMSEFALHKLIIIKKHSDSFSFPRLCFRSMWSIPWRNEIPLFSKYVNCHFRKIASEIIIFLDKPYVNFFQTLYTLGT